jgi:hypothetical protein
MEPVSDNEVIEGLKEQIKALTQLVAQMHIDLYSHINGEKEE